jgi:hypothetical protein
MYNYTSLLPESLPAWALQPRRLLGETQTTNYAYTPQAASQPANLVGRSSVAHPRQDVGDARHNFAHWRAAIPLPLESGSPLAT